MLLFPPSPTLPPLSRSPVCLSGQLCIGFISALYICLTGLYVYPTRSYLYLCHYAIECNSDTCFGDTIVPPTVGKQLL